MPINPDDITMQEFEVMLRRAGKDPFAAQEIEVVVLTELVYFRSTWSLAYFQKLLAQIPTEYNDSAFVRIESGTECDCGEIFLGYTRLETAEEIEKRVTKSLGFAREEISYELKKYEALKKKYDQSEIMRRGC